jgi:hypothetical protein
MIPADKRGNPAAHGVDGDGCGGARKIKVHDSARPEAVGGMTGRPLCYYSMWANFLPAVNSNLMVNQREGFAELCGPPTGKSVRKYIF